HARGLGETAFLFMALTPGKIFLLCWLVYALVLNRALFRRPPRSRNPHLFTRRLQSPLSLLVVGATGGTGIEIVQQALAQGHKVTAFVRDPTRLPLTHENLQIARGDVMDQASVNAAMRGQDAVLCALGHKRFSYPTHILSEGTRHLLHAMKIYEVPRLVLESSLGVSDAAGRLGIFGTLIAVPLLLPFYFWDRRRQERLVMHSEPDWVVVRPSVLTNGKARGEYQHGNVGSYFLPTRVSRADVAAFMLKQLTDDTYLGAAPGICY
ncbi:MAG: SDR family oxidoreductase, partial [Chthoniobacterales bacterium]